MHGAASRWHVWVHGRLVLGAALAWCCPSCMHRANWQVVDRRAPPCAALQCVAGRILLAQASNLCGTHVCRNSASNHPSTPGQRTRERVGEERVTGWGWGCGWGWGSGGGP